MTSPPHNAHGLIREQEATLDCSKSRLDRIRFPDVPSIERLFLKRVISISKSAAFLDAISMICWQMKFTFQRVARARIIEKISHGRGSLKAIFFTSHEGELFFNLDNAHDLYFYRRLLLTPMQMVHLWTWTLIWVISTIESELLSWSVCSVMKRALRKAFVSRRRESLAHSVGTNDAQRFIYSQFVSQLLEDISEFFHFT